MNNRMLRRNRPLTFETLESRWPLAGEVIVKVSGGNLTITGDAAANVISIDQTAIPGEFNIVGTATAVKLNGVPLVNPVHGVTKDIKIDLKQGNDEVQLNGLGIAAAATARNVAINTRAGGDVVFISNANVIGKVSVNTDAGDGVADGDIVFINAVKIAKTLSVSTGKGNDNVLVQSGEVVGNATIKMGTDSDSVESASSQKFSQNLTINTGNAGPAGIDRVFIEDGTNVVGNTSITTGDGGDLVDFDKATAHKVTVKTGAGDDLVNIAKVTNNVVIVDQALISLGAGNDVVFIGSAANVAAKLIINGLKNTTVTGGAGDADAINGVGDVIGIGFVNDPFATGVETVT